MRSPVMMPDLGVPRASLSVWFVEIDEPVTEGNRLLEILSGPATFDLSAPVTGRLVERCVFVNDPLTPGQILGYIETV